MGSAPSAGAVTINKSGAGNTTLWSVDQFTGVTQQGTNGSSAAAHATTVQDTTTTITTGLVTIATTPNADSATYGAFVTAVGSAGITAGSGYTRISTQTDTAPATSFATEWQLGTDNTVDATWAASAYCGIALEIVAHPRGIAVNKVLQALNRSVVW
jgi:hypothetical protein